MQSCFVAGAGIYFFALILGTCGVIDTTTEKIVTSMKDLIYFSTVTWTTLGYGDFRPSPEARQFAATEAIIGYLFMAVLAAELFSLAPGIRRVVDSRKQTCEGDGESEACGHGIGPC